MLKASNLSGKDLDLFIEFGRGPQTSIPHRTVHEAFLQHAQQTPDQLAVKDYSKNPVKTLTYGTLLQHAQNLASNLQTSAGVKPGDRVALVAKRGAEMVAGILGILMCGGQYIPIDGAVVPDQSLVQIIGPSNSRVIVCLERFEDKIKALVQSANIIILEKVLEDPPSTSRQLICEGNESSGCYVVYTSGTTGKPKGVDVTHENVTNLVCQFPGNLGMTKGRKVGQVLSISFDMGAWEILGSLCNGATLILRGTDWKQTLKEIDTLICTPSILARYDPKDFSNIQYIATAGEPCPKSVADEWARDKTFYNCYGPTEVTIVNTMHLHSAGSPLTIGKPTPNNYIYILGENQQPVEIGKVGIVWAGGAGITRGYIDEPDKTMDRYQYDKFIDDGISRMYNTGDLARWLPDGNLETLGRLDDQVKIKGFRVELDGVAVNIQACPGVKDAIAVMHQTELVGFVSPLTCDIPNIEEHLKLLLPYYAIPTRWHALDSLPLTSNGKTDKQALRLKAEKNSVTRDSIAATESACELREKELEAHLGKPSVAASSVDSLKEEQLVPPPLPKKQLPKHMNGLRHKIFIVYRRLFSLVWLANIAALITILVVPSIDRQWITNISYINLTLAIIVRQDTVINTIYSICCSVPKSWPLAIRKRCAKVYHFGGIHSGAATAAVCWFTGAFAYNITCICAVDKCVLPKKPSPATLTLSVLVLGLLFTMIITAWPEFRKKHHDIFERLHRFLGWTALGLIWILTMLSIQDQKQPNQALGVTVARSPTFWMLIIITLSIASSWVCLKKVPVDAQVLSNHAVRLHFDYTVPVNGTFTRLSRRPLIEWHSFATIPAPEAVNGRFKGYSLVVSRAGDWTGNEISNPTTHLWTRGIPTCGVMRIATLFNRVVLVGTGSGIGPLLGHVQVPTCPYRLIWSTQNPRDVFGDEVVSAVYNSDPDAVIHDTKTMGRPDLVKLTWDAVCQFNAEAVIVISNQKLTKKVVYEMETRGVPAYGAIWDS